jgi:hypothetical protein
MSAAIELAKPRIIPVEDRGKTYRFTVRRILKNDWLKYFSGIISSSENADGKVVNSSDSSASRLELVDAVLTNADGFPLVDGKPVTEIEDWKSKLPLGHRLAIGNTLTSVTPSAPTDEEFAFGFEKVYLDALWGAGESGGLLQYTRLLHIFRTPGVDHQRRFARDASRSTVVGGSRTGKTLWMGARTTMVELYDELIIGVDGYTVNGVPLCDPNVATEMDAYHKYVAIDVLFAPAAPMLDEEK